MLEADGRPQQARACGKSQFARPHRFECEISLTDTGIGPLAALDGADHGRAERPSELRFPHEAQVSELWPHAKVPVASGAELAEAAVEPARLSVNAGEAE